MINDLNKLPELLGKRIKILRIKHDISQEELADWAEKHYTTLSKIERGVGGYPQLDTLAKIANAFRMTVSELLDFSDL